MLGISAKTADRHVQNAYAKIGVSTRGAAGSQRLALAGGASGCCRALDRGRRLARFGRPLDPQSYVVAEPSGGLGTFCVYEAESPEAVRAHAQSAELPVDEIVPIAATVVVRPDPASVTG